MQNNFCDLAQHIEKTWLDLERSPFDAALDTKVNSDTAILYVPESEVEHIDHLRRLAALRREQKRSSAKIEIRPLKDFKQGSTHGVLYVPNNYIVPGGRFVEMYGWDSYWIIKGLLGNYHTGLAQGIIENCFYQIEHYGNKILNGNRTYYNRSHPPFLALMCEELAPHLSPSDRKKFLERASVALWRNYFQFWKKERFTPSTGLFHYGHADQGNLGLCPEVVCGERDVTTGQSHYDKITAILRAMPADDPLRQSLYDITQDCLTPRAIAGDRAMRESGFDPSMHLGFYGLRTHLHNPVCLNSLLFIHCQISARINHELGNSLLEKTFSEEAEKLRRSIRHYLLEPTQSLFYAFDIEKGGRTRYPFLTSAYPLMAGIASQREAEALRDIVSEQFETAYGIRSTPLASGCQWDGYMWAPLVDMLIKGYENYGFECDAARISGKFLDTVGRVFRSDGKVYEKYDPVKGTSNMGDVSVGYEENQIGFGWTNAVSACLMDKYGSRASLKHAGDFSEIPHP